MQIGTHRHNRFYSFLLAVLISVPNLLSANETVLIGAEDDWFPYSALKDGVVQGMSVDIVKAAFAASNTSVELRPYPYPRCMQMVLKGKLVACFNTASNEQTAKDYLLAETPLFSDDTVLWARINTPQPITELTQIAGKKVAVTIGYEYGTRFDSNQQLVRVPVRKDIYGFLMLQHRRVDYSVAYRGTAEQLFRDHPELAGQFSAVATLDRPQLYLSFSRQNRTAPLMLERFEYGMQVIHNNGLYEQIIQHWQHNTAH
jgi:polar amino acid transport system substrate-binding protein